MTYLISFDRDVVLNALNQVYGSKSESYLGKIVQISMAVPATSQKDMENLFLEKLLVVVNSIDFIASEQRAYWIDIYSTGIKPYLKTPRDVIRLMNTFYSTYFPIRDEVNWVDFLAIEAIKVFNMSLYNEILNHKEKFLGTFRSNPATDAAQLEEYFQDLFGHYAGKGSEHVRPLLRSLFPKILRTGYSSDIESSWRKELRICSPDIFDIYFQLNVRSENIKNEELQLLSPPRHRRQEHVLKTTSPPVFAERR